MKNTFLFISISFLLICITKLIGFDGFYGQDAYEYLRYTKALVNFITNQEHPGNYFWPLYYPITGGLIALITKSVSFSLQFVSIAALAISFIYLKKCIQVIYKSNLHTNLYLFLFFSLSPYVFKLGVSSMSDMLSVCYIILSFYHLITFTTQSKIEHVYYGLIFFILASMTRYAAFVVLLPSIIYSSIYFFRKNNFYMHIIPLALIALFFIFPHYYIRSENPTAFLSHNALSDWTSLNLFKREFITDEGYHKYRLPNIIYVTYHIFSPIYLFAGFPLTLMLLKIKTPVNKLVYIVIASCLVYSIFLGGIASQNKRFLLLAFPFVILLLYPSFIKVLEKIQNKRLKQSVLLSCFIIQISFCSYSILPLIKRNHLEKEIVTMVKPYQNKKLYSFDIDIALQGRELTFDYKNMFMLQHIEPQKGDYVLFNPEQFKTQWKNKMPIKNWNFIVENYTLKTIESHKTGWKLYEIE